MGVTLTDILKVALSVVFPPAAVIIEKERCDADVLINCLLTVLGWIPGESGKAPGFPGDTAMMSLLACRSGTRRL